MKLKELKDIIHMPDLIIVATGINARGEWVDYTVLSPWVASNYPNMVDDTFEYFGDNDVFRIEPTAFNRTIALHITLEHCDIESVIEFIQKKLGGALGG